MMTAQVQAGYRVLDDEGSAIWGIWTGTLNQTT